MIWMLVTLDLPPDTPVGLPAGRWERVDGKIRATYTREEMVVALGMLEVKDGAERQEQERLAVIKAE